MRCIKPNDEKSANLFDQTRIEHQIAYLGLLENVRVRRAGETLERSADGFDRFPRFQVSVIEHRTIVLFNGLSRRSEIDEKREKNVFLRIFSATKLSTVFDRNCILVHR